MARVLQVLRYTATSTIYCPHRDDVNFLKEACDEWLVAVDGGNIRWSDAPTINGVTETISASVGTKLTDGDYIPYRGDPAKFRFVLSSGTPLVAIHRYQRTAW